MAINKIKIGDTTHELQTTIANVTNLQSSLNGKANSSHTHDDRYYTESEIDSKVSSLQSSINGKAASSHTHDYLPLSGGTVSGDVTVGDGNTSTTSKTGSLSVGGNLQITCKNDNYGIMPSANNYNSIGSSTKKWYNLYVNNIYKNGTEIGDLYADSSHTHSISDVTNLQSALDGKAASSHTHDDRYYTESEIDSKVSSLQSSINGKANISHTHTAVNGVTPEWSGSISDSDAIWIAAWNSDGSKIKALDKRTMSVYYASYAGSADAVAWDKVTGKPALRGGEIGRIGDGINGEIFNDYQDNIASGDYSHAEGYYTSASGDYSHAEGCFTTASGDYSHAEGSNTTASGDYSHAEGSGCLAGSKYVHAEGYQTIAQVYNVHVQGHYNSAPASGSTTGTSGTAFIIGNGTSSTRSNAFRVSYAGKPYALSSLNTSGADYAEFFEWLDSNPDGEDRRGYFVTLDGDKIKIAEPGDYILGIISALPAVIGNGDEGWKGRYILDDFGAFITEEFEYDMEEPVEIVDEETGETKIETQIVKKTGTKYKENPDYDPSVPYIQREDRPEWDTVGMMGVLAVRDDGTCKVNGYCKVAEGGIATTSENGYRVIARVNENIVRVIFR